MAENVLDLGFHAPAPNRVWVWDITYIPTKLTGIIRGGDTALG